MYTLSDDLKEKILGCLKPNERILLLLGWRYIKMVSRRCKANNSSPEVTNVLDNCVDMLEQINEYERGHDVPYSSFYSFLVTIKNKVKVFFFFLYDIKIDLPEKLVEEVRSSMSLKDIEHLGDSVTRLLRVSIICDFYGLNPEVTETFRNAASLVSQFYYH